MRRTSTVVLISLLAALACACGAPEPTAKTAPTGPEAEPRSVDPAAAAPAECAWPEGSEAQPAPACPPGCKWDGSKCKDERGIIVHQ